MRRHLKYTSNRLQISKVYIIMILNLISFFSGFLTSSIIDTSLGEFSEWAIVGAAIVSSKYRMF